MLVRVAWQTPRSLRLQRTKCTGCTNCLSRLLVRGQRSLARPEPQEMPL
jgi:hypothetical protein